MQIDEIYDLWSDDVYLDPTELSTHSLDIPKLHNKYYRILSNENLLLKKHQERYKVLYRDKYEYYRGQLDYDTLKERGWEPFELKIMKTDIPIYLDADKDLINANLQIALYQEKIEVLKAIIKDLSQRSFNIKNAIEFMKLQAGAI